jgi:Family of unknown function (DUF5309)
MAQITGTTDSYRVGAAGGNREDLEDTIWDLFPDETYCLTNLDKVEASGVYHEHLTDGIVAPTTNRQIEGDDASFVTVVSPTRVGNYQQITRKTFLISRTQEKLAKAGRRRESTRQVTKQMRELKNEMEYAIVRNQASSAGGSATARSTASMESWMSTNKVLATTTSSSTTPGFSGGVVAGPTDGTTTGALTIGALNLALQGSWSSGGQATQIIVSPTQKQVIDTFTGVATRFVDVDRAAQASIINASNLYVSSFGRHTVRMHRHVRPSIVLCLDPDMWAISFIDRPFMEKLAKTGDGDKYQIVGEWGLVSRNEAASAKVVSCA